ncbi:MAG: LCP family protein [Candidatus Peribacteraceae bacterium]|nr:LCP family protein [Candidatus Peribacteraceae bacterium]MDD5074298.1 LCP family protein [Candidatus Peribacteraceae bacterium]
MSFQIRRVTAARKKRRFPWERIPLMLSITRPLVQWYASWRKRRQEEEKHEMRMTILKRTLLILFAVLCAFLLLAGTVKALVSLRIISVKSIIAVSGTELPKDEHGFTNILLLGQGDVDHDGKDLTDTIIVASIDPAQTKSAVMLSLPRDLYLLKTGKMGKGRINSLYRDYKIMLKRKGMKESEASQEAMKELAKEIGAHLNLTIHHVIKADFTGFVRAVDAAGGVDVNVPYDINDTEYPDENYGFRTFAIKAGPAHLDGETALKYVRSRHTTSDFDRSARQQQFIVALGEKVKAQKLYRNTGTIAEMMRIFSEHVEMTMTLRELVGLANLAENVTPSNVIAMQLNDRNGLYGGLVEPGGFLYTPPRDLFEGASVLLPVSIPEYPVTWKQIHALSTLLFEHRSIFLSPPTIAILNAGAKSGLGRKLANELIRYGWNVDNVANATLEKRADSLVAPAADQDAETAKFFADLLQLPQAPLPALLPSVESRRITIILGKGYTFRALQDLLPTE